MSGTTPPSNDEAIVARIRGGDADAERELFTRHVVDLRARLGRRIPSRLRAKVAASDVIQEACWAAFRRLAEFEDRGPGSFGRWLGGIVDNKLREEVRRHLGTEKRDVRREVAPVASDAPSPARSREPSPSGVAIAAEEALALRRAMERLPADHRTVLGLLYERGLSLKEAGERMGRSPDAVRMLYGRALASLAEVLGRSGRGDGS